MLLKKKKKECECCSLYLAKNSPGLLMQPYLSVPLFSMRLGQWPNRFISSEVITCGNVLLKQITIRN